jgi:L-threonylcarbamoyladenylate synthase
MQTDVVKIDAHRPDANAIERAASVLRAGGLVAFPTETVYGLGANALDAEVALRIFTAKGRPANNPLIVHVTSVAEARALTTAWPAEAEILAERFWPGPLTLVLTKNARVPDATTAGGGTVAIRIPSHSVACALIAAAGFPLAAPSANSSVRITATSAEHVYKMLAGRIDMILDGGSTPGGMESTVVDLSHGRQRLLRPGLLGLAEIEAALGAPIDHVERVNEEQAMPSPGMMDRHYAPTVPLECFEQGSLAAAIDVREDVGLLTFGPSAGSKPKHIIELPKDVAGYSALLYDALHRLEDRGVARIVVELPPDSPEWLAVRDRLRRASWRA